MTNRAKRDRDIFKVVIPLLFLVVTVGIYIPSSLYFGNIDEFSISYMRFLPGILLPCVCVFAIGLLVAYALRRNERLLNAFTDLMFGFTLGMYVQGNFLNGMLKQLNGTEINWDPHAPLAIISIVAWCACLILPHIIRAASSKVETLIVTYGSLLLTVMQVVSLIVLILTTPRNTSTDISTTKKDEFLLSKNDNTIVFVVDTLDAQWFEHYILDNPEYAQRLDGFTYFDNVVSCGAPTILGMRMMLTGKVYDPKVPFDEYLKHVYDGETLFDDIHNNGYSLRLYTLQTYLTGANTQSIDNVVQGQEYKIKENSKFIKDIYKLTAFYGLPYCLKPHFLIYSGELTNNAAISDGENENWIADDPQFYSDFLEQGLSADDSQNAFVLYHLFGAHGPYSMNEAAQKVEADQTSLEQQIHGSFKIICDFMDEMKRLDIYENSTIIITADHGGVDVYQNPAVLIKRKGTHGGMALDSAPLTFANLRASFVEDILEDYRDTYGPGMFDVPEDQDVGYRPHTFDSILYTNHFPDAVPIKGTYLQFQIGNPARDGTRIIDAHQTYDYTLGTEIAMCGEEADRGFVVGGFSIIEDQYRWTDGDAASISLGIGDPYEDLAFSMQYKTFNGIQHVLLYANGTLVYEGDLSGGTLDNIRIPHECVKDGVLDLRFELPDAVSPAELGVSEDSRKLAISMESFKVSAAK